MTYVVLTKPFYFITLYLLLGILFNPLHAAYYTASDATFNGGHKTLQYAGNDPVQLIIMPQGLMFTPANSLQKMPVGQIQPLKFGNIPSQLLSRLMGEREQRLTKLKQQKDSMTQRLSQLHKQNNGKRNIMNQLKNKWNRSQTKIRAIENNIQKNKNKIQSGGFFGGMNQEKIDVKKEDQIKNTIIQLQQQIKQLEINAEQQNEDYKQAKHIYEDAVNNARNIDSENNDIARKIRQLKQLKQRLQQMQVYNVGHLFVQQPKGELMVKLGNHYLYLESHAETIQQATLFGERSRVSRVEYRLISAWNATFHPVKQYPTAILTLMIDYNKRLVGFGWMDSTIYSLRKIITPELKKFLKEQALRPTQVRSFDFSKTTLHATYVEVKKGITQRMRVSFKMSGKRKNLIKIKMTAPISLFDPENESDQTESNTGMLGNIRGKELVQISKKQVVNNRTDVKWINKPKKSIIKIDYRSGKNQEVQLVTKSRHRQTYGFEGLWYLASLMNQHNKNSKTIMLISGVSINDFTMKKRNNSHYVLTKEGQDVYHYYLDNKHIIKRFEFPYAGQEINLESLDSDETLKNKKYLEKLIRQHQFVYIKP